MKLSKLISTSAILLLLLQLGFSWAQKTRNQSREQLESQRISIIEEIKRTQEQLELLRKDKKASIAELQALQAKLSARQSLINNINNEINIIEQNIEHTSHDVYQLKTELDTLKKGYAQMVRYTYKNRTSSDMIVFLFSASTFNDAIRRLKYVKQFRNYRADQAIKITSASQQLSNKINILNMEKQKKDYVLNAQEMQNKALVNETAEKDKLVSQLQGKEKELLAGLAKKTKAAESLNKAIANAIQKEINLARKRAMDEKIKQQQALKSKNEAERRLAIQKKAQEIALAEKEKHEKEEAKLAQEKKAQEEKEKQAAIDKKNREELERKLAQEKKDREEQEKALALEQKKRLAAEKKAAQMAEAHRIENEQALAIEKQKQEERQQKLENDRKDQEERQKQLMVQKQRQEEEQRNLIEEKKRQEREQARLATNVPYNNPRYIAALAEKTKQAIAEEVESTTTASATSSTAKTFASDDYKFSLTPEERQLTSNFEANKGRLPWPVEKGFITEHFGKNKHPLFNITTENYGIDIKTSRGAGARAIFAGEVNSVINIPGMGQTVLVNHGSFYTVYSKLDKVFVTKGAKLNNKQSIGTVLTDDDGNTQIHFEIWKVGANGQPFKVNPEQWVAQ